MRHVLVVAAVIAFALPVPGGSYSTVAPPSWEGIVNIVLSGQLDWQLLNGRRERIVALLEANRARITKLGAEGPELALQLADALLDKELPQVSERCEASLKKRAGKGKLTISAAEKDEWTECAQALAGTKKSGSALVAYEAIFPYTKDGVVLQDYGNLLFAEGRIPEAIAVARQAVPLTPIKWRYHTLNNLCWYLAVERRFIDARPHCEESVKQNPVYWQGWDSITVVYEELGLLGAARKANAKVLELNPGNADATARKERYDR